MKTLTFDLEAYSNYSLFALRDVESHELITFEIRGKKKSLKDKHIKKLRDILTSNNIITFNGLKFDEPITAYALQGATAKEIHEAVQSIIVGGVTVWDFYRNIKSEKFIKHHIDIMDVARGSASLKLYGARLGTKKLQDLPYAPETTLTKHEMDEVLLYCENDNVVTDDLFQYLDSDLELRRSMSEEYGMDFMSFKGAKIAEMILAKECGYTGKAPSIPEYVKPKLPKYLKFKMPELDVIYKKIKKHTFLIMTDNILQDLDKHNLRDEYTFLLDDLSMGKSPKIRHGKKTKKTISNSGNVIQPDFLDAPIIIDGVSYKLGLGGVHGSVESTSIIPTKKETIVDIDYRSLYPRMIIVNDFSPKHLGSKFAGIYSHMYNMRNNVLKPAMKKCEYGSKEYKDLDRKQDSMKLVLNSSFGQTGQRFSKIYDPNTMLNTTLTGQLTLMMVIEKLHLKGYRTFYANTDGITLKVRKKDVKKVQKITQKFDKETGLEMEYNFFKSSHIRDVNNFINITDDGKVKSKGAFGEPNLEKNAHVPIVFEAVRKFLQDGTPMNKTIKKCKVVKDFCSSRAVTGGAMYATSIPEMYPDGWEESLTRNKRITKKMEALKAKEEAVWVKDNGNYLGKVVRWYYSLNGASIHYKKSGNKVPMSDGCFPMMDLTKKLPKDLDYQWYYDYADRMLADLGLTLS